MDVMDNLQILCRNDGLFHLRYLVIAKFFMTGSQRHLKGMGQCSKSPEDDWLENKKEVIIIHQLHTILKPFMLFCHV